MAWRFRESGTSAERVNGWERENDRGDAGLMLRESFLTDKAGMTGLVPEAAIN